MSFQGVFQPQEEKQTDRLTDRQTEEKKRKRKRREYKDGAVRIASRQQSATFCLSSYCFFIISAKAREDGKTSIHPLTTKYDLEMF